MTEQLREKLLSYEVPPPPGAWKTIATELNESNQLLPLADKLYQFEVTPPGNAWKIISDSFGYADNLPVESLSIKRRVNPVMAAAAVFGLLLMGSLYVLYNNSARKQVSGIQKNSIKGNTNEKRAEPSIPDITTSAIKQATAISTIASNFITRKEKKNSFGSGNKSLRKSIVKIASSIISARQISIAAKPIRNERGDIIQDMNLVSIAGNKYITITGPNGQQTKISSKFLNLLLYLNRDSDIQVFEGYFDKNFLESLIWKSRFDDWRKKIIQTSFSPSSTNFMDILEFKDLINEN